MRRWKLLVPVLALGVVIVACGDEADGPDDAGATTDDASGEDAADDDAETAPDLAVADSDLGEILVDGDGMTLYLFTQDPPGESVCADDCLAAWPPLVVDGEPVVGEGVDPDLVSTLTRDDGSTQVTYDDAPLYRWASDEAPGDVTGQGVQDVWYVVAPDGTAITEAGAGGDDSEETERSPSY